MDAECPRLVVNREPVGHELGVRYGEQSSRDVFGEGECDVVFLELAGRLGWLEMASTRSLTTPPHLPAWCLLELRPLLRTPERRLSILEACGGPQEPASGRPPRPKVEGLSPFIFQPPRTRRLGWLPELLAFEERMPPQSRELLRAAVEAQGVRRA